MFRGICVPPLSYRFIVFLWLLIWFTTMVKIRGSNAIVNLEATVPQLSDLKALWP